jgi:cytochrome c oxidase subunit III
MNIAPRVIDVTDLPASAFDTRAPVWWGNTLMLVIESMSVILLVASYFYNAQAYPDWPPPRVEQYPAILKPVPDLTPGTWNAALLAFSIAPMIWADWAARRYRFAHAVIALAVLTLIGIAAMVLRVYEFPATKFRWDDNAYASLVWAILGLHFTYLILATAEVGILVLWLLLHGLDEKHAVDVTLTAVYWYWAAGVGLFLYGVVYWAPRIMS